MSAMRTWIRQRPVTAFYVLTLLISWGYWFTLIAQGKQVAPGSNVSHFPGLLGPCLAAFIVTAFVNGKTGVTDLLRRMLRWRSAWPGGVLTALSPLPLAAVVIGVLYLLGTPLPAMQDFALYPGLPAGLPLWAVIVVVFIVNGYGEEVGWRGFLTERLLQRYDRFHTTLRVAGFWLIWHIPVFWINQSMAALVGPMLLGWALGLVCGAFFLTHLYLSSGRSILVLALWHMNYNMMVAPPVGAGIPAAVVSTIIMLWGGVIAWLWWRESRAKHLSDTD
jgi:membrane protease YdiL (CAAX protease family)